MTTPVSSSIGIPADVSRRRGSRGVSATVLHDLEEPRPLGGWNTLERFASSYQRSTTFFGLDTGSPASYVFRDNHRPHITNIEDDSAVVDDEEDTSLLTARWARASHSRQHSIESDIFGNFRHVASPKPGEEIYGAIRRGSRRPSLLGAEPGGPELLIKEVEDDAGNIIEVVVGQVMPS